MTPLVGKGERKVTSWHTSVMPGLAWRPPFANNGSPNDARRSVPLGRGRISQRGRQGTGTRANPPTKINTTTRPTSGVTQARPTGLLTRPIAS